MRIRSRPSGSRPGPVSGSECCATMIIGKASFGCGTVVRDEHGFKINLSYATSEIGSQDIKHSKVTANLPLNSAKENVGLPSVHGAVSVPTASKFSYTVLEIARQGQKSFNEVCDQIAAVSIEPQLPLDKTTKVWAPSRKKVKTFQLSTYDKEDRALVCDMIHQLGGIVIDKNADYDPRATHIVVRHIDITEKITAALAAGKWIVQTAYVTSSYKVGYWLPEKDFEIGYCCCSYEMLLKPSCEMEMSMRFMENAPRRCREMVLVKMKPFLSHWNVGLLVDRPNTEETLLRILKAGGAKVTILSMPLGRNWKQVRKVDWVFADVKDVNCLLIFKKLKIRCVPTNYIYDYLHRDPPPSMESYSMKECYQSGKPGHYWSIPHHSLSKLHRLKNNYINWCSPSTKRLWESADRCKAHLADIRCEAWRTLETSLGYWNCSRQVNPKQSIRVDGFHNAEGTVSISSWQTKCEGETRSHSLTSDFAYTHNLNRKLFSTNESCMPLVKRRSFISHSVVKPVELIVDVAPVSEAPISENVVSSTQSPSAEENHENVCEFKPVTCDVKVSSSPSLPDQMSDRFSNVKESSEVTSHLMLDSMAEVSSSLEPKSRNERPKFAQSVVSKRPVQKRKLPHDQSNKNDKYLSLKKIKRDVNSRKLKDEAVLPRKRTKVMELQSEYKKGRVLQELYKKDKDLRGNVKLASIFERQIIKTNMNEKELGTPLINPLHRGANCAKYISSPEVAYQSSKLLDMRVNSHIIKKDLGTPMINPLHRGTNCAKYILSPEVAYQSSKLLDVRVNSHSDSRAVDTFCLNSEVQTNSFEVIDLSQGDDCVNNVSTKESKQGALTPGVLDGGGGDDDDDVTFVMEAMMEKDSELVLLSSDEDDNDLCSLPQKKVIKSDAPRLSDEILYISLVSSDDESVVSLDDDTEPESSFGEYRSTESSVANTMTNSHDKKVNRQVVHAGTEKLLHSVSIESKECTNVKSSSNDLLSRSTSLILGNVECFDKSDLISCTQNYNTSELVGEINTTSEDFCPTSQEQYSVQFCRSGNLGSSRSDSLSGISAPQFIEGHVGKRDLTFCVPSTLTTELGGESYNPNSCPCPPSVVQSSIERHGHNGMSPGVCTLPKECSPTASILEEITDNGKNIFHNVAAQRACNILRRAPSFSDDFVHSSGASVMTKENNNCQSTRTSASNASSSSAMIDRTQSIAVSGNVHVTDTVDSINTNISLVSIPVNKLVMSTANSELHPVSSSITNFDNINVDTYQCRKANVQSHFDVSNNSSVVFNMDSVKKDARYIVILPNITKPVSISSGALDNNFETVVLNDEVNPNINQHIISSKSSVVYDCPVTNGISLLSSFDKGDKVQDEQIENKSMSQRCISSSRGLQDRNNISEMCNSSGNALVDWGTNCSNDAENSSDSLPQVCIPNVRNRTMLDSSISSKSAVMYDCPVTNGISLSSSFDKGDKVQDEQIENKSMSQRCIGSSRGLQDRNNISEMCNSSGNALVDWGTNCSNDAENSSDSLHQVRIPNVRNRTMLDSSISSKSAVVYDCAVTNGISLSSSFDKGDKVQDEQIENKSMSQRCISSSRGLQDRNNISEMCNSSGNALVDWGTNCSNDAENSSDSLPQERIPNVRNRTMLDSSISSKSAVVYDCAVTNGISLSSSFDKGDKVQDEQIENNSMSQRCISSSHGLQDRNNISEMCNSSGNALVDWGTNCSSDAENSSDSLPQVCIPNVRNRTMLDSGEISSKDKLERNVNDVDVECRNGQNNIVHSRGSLDSLDRSRSGSHLFSDLESSSSSNNRKHALKKPSAVATTKIFNKIMYQSFDCPWRRLTVLNIPRCCDHPAACRQLHGFNKNCARELDHSLSGMIEAQVNDLYWSQALDFLSNTITPEVYPRASLMRLICDFILNTHDEMQCARASQILKTLLRTHPPCAYKMSSYYKILLFDSVVQRDQCVAGGLVYRIINLIEDELKLHSQDNKSDPTHVPRSSPVHCDSKSDCDSNMDWATVPPEELDHVIETYFEKEQKYYEDPAQQYDDLPNQERIRRLFLVLEFILDVLEQELLVWVVKYSFRAVQAAANNTTKPLVAIAVWGNSKVIGHSEFCRQLLLTYLKCFAAGWTNSYKKQFLRFLTLVAMLVFTVDQHDVVHYPHIGANCEDLAQDVATILVDSNLSVCERARVVANLEPPWLCLYVCHSATKRLSGVPQDLDLQTMTANIISVNQLMQAKSSPSQEGILTTSNGVKSQQGFIAEKGLRNVNKRKATGETRLHVVCRNNRVAELRKLMKIPGLDVNARDNYGWTALHEAAHYGHSESVEILLQYQLPSGFMAIDPRVPNEKGMTPLIDAVDMNHINVCQVLMQYGGKDLLLDKMNGKSALDLASTPELKDILKSASGHCKFNPLLHLSHSVLKEISLLLPIMVRSYINMYEVLSVTLELFNLEEETNNIDQEAQLSREGKRNFNFNIRRYKKDYTDLRNMQAMITKYNSNTELMQALAVYVLI